MRRTAHRSRSREHLGDSQSETWLKAVFNTALDAIITMNPAGMITAWNSQAESTFGWGEAEAVGGSLSDLIIPPQHREAHEKGIARFLVTGEGPILRKRIEITALHRDGREFPVELTVCPMRKGGDWHFSAFVRDLTERRRGEEAQARLAAIVESSHDAILSMDMSGTIVTWNAAAEQLYCYTAHEVIGQHLSLLVPEDQPDEIPGIMKRLARGERIEHYETVRVRRGGTRVSVTLTISPLRDGRGNIIGASTIVRDNTERKQVEKALREGEQQLQALSRRLVEVQEMERAFIARELHDQIGQMLSAVKVNLEMISRDADPGLARRAAEGIVAVTRAIEQVQNLSFELRPSLLDDLGLAAAVDAYAKRQAEAARLQLGLAICVACAVPKHIETACFRIIQEAVTNVVRHARARRLELELCTSGDRLDLVARDDGVGFDAVALAATAPVERRLGLVGMRERAVYVGGELDVQSTPGVGTIVRAQFPLGAADPGREL